MGWYVMTVSVRQVQCTISLKEDTSRKNVIFEICNLISYYNIHAYITVTSGDDLMIFFM